MAVAGSVFHNPRCKFGAGALAGAARTQWNQPQTGLDPRGRIYEPREFRSLGSFQFIFRWVKRLVQEGFEEAGAGGVGGGQGCFQPVAEGHEGV